MLLGFFCLLAIAASRDEELSKEKEPEGSLKPVRVMDREMSRKEETVKTRSARSTDRKSSRKRKGKKKEFWQENK